MEYRPANTAGSAAPKGSFLARGQAQLAAGVASLAIESFRSEIRKSPDSGDAYNGMAIAYDRIGRADLAQRYFETAMAKAPDDPKFRNNLAQLFERTGREQMASNLRAASSLAIAAVPEIASAPQQAVSAELAVTNIIALPAGAEDALLVMQEGEATLIAKMDPIESNASAPEITNRAPSIAAAPEYLHDKGILISHLLCRNPV